MSDDQPPESNLDRIRRRMAGALDEVKTVEGPRVVDIFTRGEVVPADSKRGKAAKKPKNTALIEFLKGILAEAKAGDITSMSLIVSGPQVPWACNVFLIDSEEEDPEKTAMVHIAALNFLEENLKDAAVGFHPDMLEEMGVDEEGFFPE